MGTTLRVLPSARAAPCPRRLVSSVGLLAALAVLGACADASDALPGARGDAPPTPPAEAAGRTVGDAARAADPGAAPAPGSTSADGPTVRVVFLGTSLTAGLGVLRREDTFVDRLGAMAAGAGLHVQVVNAGVSGETSAGGLRRLDWLLEEPLDVLFLELGANDGLRGQDPGAMETNLRQVIRRTRDQNPGARVVLAGMQAPPNLGQRYTDRFRDVFPRVAREEGATLVPFLLQGVGGVPALNQGDGIHPNEEGHAEIARYVWPFLEPVLREVLQEKGGQT